MAGFERALEFIPQNVGTWVALGWTHFVRADFVQAEQTFRQALAVDRNFAESHGGLATVLVHLGRLEEGRAEVELARGLDPESFGWVYAHSELLARDGKKDLGVRLFQRALERSPGGTAPRLIDSLRAFLAQQPSLAQRPGLGIPPPVERPLRPKPAD